MIGPTSGLWSRREMTCCVVYESRMRVPSMPIIPLASWFKMENGRIVHFHVHFDPTPFVKARESGAIAKTLQPSAANA